MLFIYDLSNSPSSPNNFIFHTINEASQVKTRLWDKFFFSHFSTPSNSEEAPLYNEPTLAVNRRLVFVLLLFGPFPLITLFTQFCCKIGVYWKLLLFLTIFQSRVFLAEKKKNCPKLVGFLLSTFFDASNHDRVLLFF